MRNPLPRPLAVTIVAVLLVLVGIGANAYFAADTFRFVSRARGSWFDRGFMLYLHILWAALAVAGWGLWRGFDWSRLLLIAALIGMLLVTAFPEFDAGQLVTHSFFYCLVVWLLFRPSPNAYFAANSPRSAKHR